MQLLQGGKWFKHVSNFFGINQTSAKSSQQTSSSWLVNQDEEDSIPLWKSYPKKIAVTERQWPDNTEALGLDLRYLDFSKKEDYKKFMEYKQKELESAKVKLEVLKEFNDFS